LKVTDEKSRIRIRIRCSKVRIRGSRSLPKCHGSGILVSPVQLSLTWPPSSSRVPACSKQRWKTLSDKPIKSALCCKISKRESDLNQKRPRSPYLDREHKLVECVVRLDGLADGDGQFHELLLPSSSCHSCCPSQSCLCAAGSCFWTI
jgi:hypothetical protein